MSLTTFTKTKHKVFTGLRGSEAFKASKRQKHVGHVGQRRARGP